MIIFEVADFTLGLLKGNKNSGDSMKSFTKQVLIIFIALFTSSVHASQSVEQAQFSSMQQVIERQLDAFAKGDATAAYAQASPLIQAMFPNQDIFMAMVRNGYGALISPSQVDFLGVEKTADGPVFGVKIYARDGSLWLAAYQMVLEDQEDWRINGCRVTRYSGETT